MRAAGFIPAGTSPAAHLKLVPLIVLGVLGLFAGIADPAQAAVTDKLRTQLQPLAKAIVEVLGEEKQTTIAIGEFRGPAQFSSNYGAGIEQLLAQELEALQKGIVKTESVLSIKGDYEFIQAKDLQVIELSVVIKKNNGEKVGQLTKRLNDTPLKIDDSEVIAALTGRTISLPPTADRETLNKKIQDNINKKDTPFHRQGTRIATSEKSPFAIELLVTSKDKAPKEFAGWTKVAARDVAALDAEAFVAIECDEVYAVRVFNKTKHEAAVALSIDGIDVFTFSEVRKPDGRPKLSHFIVAPGTSIIPGWHKNNKEVLSFLVTEYGQGAVSKVAGASRGKVGVLTVTFALAWQGDNVPPEEKGSRNAGGNETGFGPPSKVDLKEVDRKIGAVRDIISVRYAH